MAHQVIKQTKEEKVAMYMKSSKRELVDMLIECNNLLDGIASEIRPHPILEPNETKDMETSVQNTISVQSTTTQCKECGNPTTETKFICPCGYSNPNYFERCPVCKPTETQPSSPTTPHRCPICGGSGIVESGFYQQTGGQWTSAGGIETCKTCNGQGIVWS